MHRACLLSCSKSVSQTPLFKTGRYLQIFGAAGTRMDKTNDLFLTSLIIFVAVAFSLLVIKTKCRWGVERMVKHSINLEIPSFCHVLITPKRSQG